MQYRAVPASPEGFTLSALNDPSRTWPESNCYLDLWIGLLRAVGQDARPLMGAAAGMGWEGDHFTFIKPSAADLFDLTGTVLQEMALWDETEAHVAAQVALGAVAIPEVDSFFLPDTGDYQRQHGKTTIGVIAIDTAARVLEYVHNGGLFRLGGDDYAGVLGLAPYARALFPYAELARLPAAPPGVASQRAAARLVLRRLVAMRAPGNPVESFVAALPALLGRPGVEDKVHALCFNTARQLGAGFGLLAEHLDWLGHDGRAATRLSEQAKTFQFQLARAARRGRCEAALTLAGEAMAGTWSEAAAAIAGAASAGVDASEAHRTTGASPRCGRMEMKAEEMS